MPLPSAGGAATPPIIDAAMTQAPARRAPGTARVSQGRPVGKIGAMKRPTAGVGVGGQGGDRGEREAGGHPGAADHHDPRGGPAQGDRHDQEAAHRHHQPVHGGRGGRQRRRAAEGLQVRGFPAADARLDAHVQDVQDDEAEQDGRQQPLPAGVLGRGVRDRVGAHAPRGQGQTRREQGQTGEGVRVAVAAQDREQGGAEDGADAEVGVEDVEHGGAAAAEADGEQLVEAVVDAAEAEPGEQRGGQGGGPVRGDGEGERLRPSGRTRR